MNLGKIIKLFKNGNVCVVGLRGSGKDTLCSNVTQYRKMPYIATIDYGNGFNPLTPDIFSMNGNTFRNLKEHSIRKYVYPYPDKTDIYLSDCGIYYPSQECSFLDKVDKGLPLFMALSRQLGLCNVHLNVQNLDRAWTKIREQSDTYIMCNWCKWFGNLVIQSVTIYERADSCQMRVPPCPYKTPFLCPRDMKEHYNIKRLEYRVQYGEIKKYLLIYFNKSKFDTRAFKKMFEEGEE